MSSKVKTFVFLLTTPTIFGAGVGLYRSLSEHNFEHSDHKLDIITKNMRDGIEFSNRLAFVVPAKIIKENIIDKL